MSKTNDIVPGLLSRIRKTFKNRVDSDRRIRELCEKLDKGTATYAEVNEIAEKIGEHLAGTFAEHITEDILPDGKMYYNIANRIVPPMLLQNHKTVSDYAAKVQQRLNKNVGLDIRPQEPAFNSDRANMLVNKITSYPTYKDAAWLLQEPVINFTQNVVDTFVKQNAEFHAKANIRAVITRKTAGKCCEWCSRLAGTYTYPKVPKDVYRRHASCRCTVEYLPGNGKKQNVHSRKWEDEGKEDRIILHNERLAKRSSRARNINNEVDLNEVSHSVIIEMESYEEIVEYFKKEHDIEIEGFQKKELFKIKATLAGFDDFLNLFENTEHSIRKIKYNHRLRSYGIMDEFKISEIGPKGIGDYGTGVHEATHALDYISSRPELHTFAEKIVKQASKNIGLSRNKKVFEKKAFEFIGILDESKKLKEIFAYAIETELGKGSDSNELSKEILKVLKEVENGR